MRLANILQWNANVALANDDVLLAGNLQPFSCNDVDEIPFPECEALVVLYVQAGGDNWTNHEGWLETDTACNWHGVTCSNGHVSELRLTSNNLIGVISSHLGDLTFLQVLLLDRNQLHSEIPWQLGYLTNLQSLYLRYNQLTGTIPPELGNLTSLQILYLYVNQLSSSPTYENIIIDNSPGWDTLAVNVLFFAKEVLCPVTLETLAVQGLIDYVNRVERIGRSSGVKLAYVLPTMLDRRLAQTPEIHNQLKQQFGNILCEPVRSNVRLSEAPAFGETIFEYAANSRGAVDYAKLVERVIADE
ncbi:MAG: leucine-rich repeat domain-containing protein [Candidatus Promineifilaceae bacterium]